MSTAREMTPFYLNQFESVPIVVPIECFNAQKTYRKISLNEASLELQFESDRNKMIDLQENFLLLNNKLSKRNVALEAADDARSVNNTTHCFFLKLPGLF